MAPEQNGKNKYDKVKICDLLVIFKSVDIWAMGVIFYKLLHNNKHPLYKDGMTRTQYIKVL